LLAWYNRGAKAAALVPAPASTFPLSFLPFSFLCSSSNGDIKPGHITALAYTLTPTELLYFSTATARLEIFSFAPVQKHSKKSPAG
jgi:hypothetical protein